jgi:hypothetical protein
MVISPYKIGSSVYMLMAIKSYETHIRKGTVKNLHFLDFPVPLGSEVAIEFCPPNNNSFLLVNIKGEH